MTSRSEYTALVVRLADESSRLWRAKNRKHAINFCIREILEKHGLIKVEGAEGLISDIARELARRSQEVQRKKREWREALVRRSQKAAAPSSFSEFFPFFSQQAGTVFPLKRMRRAAH